METLNLERLHVLLKGHEQLLEEKRSPPDELLRQNEQFQEAFVRLVQSTILPVLEEIRDVLAGKVESISVLHLRTVVGLRIKLDRWEDFERSLIFFGDHSIQTVRITHEGVGFGLLSQKVGLRDVTPQLVEDEAMKFLRRLLREEQLRWPMDVGETFDGQADRTAAADRSARLRAAVESNPALAAEISSLELLDDHALWNAAQTRMPEPDSERMEELHRKQRLTGLSEAEAQELARLEQQYERVILVRSHSALLLEQRGHDIARLIPRNESRRPASGEIRSLTAG
jgi:hypothetical protein